jgi:hypothetical protein
MEDRAICVPDLLELHGASLSYYAVFDGHEGAAAAELASTQLHATLANRLRSLPQCGAPRLCVTSTARRPPGSPLLRGMRVAVNSVTKVAHSHPLRPRGHQTALQLAWCYQAHQAVSAARRPAGRWPDVRGSDVEAALRSAVAEADAAVLAAARGGAGGAPGAAPLPDGTTAVWGLLWRRALLVAWLGDSRAVLCRWAPCAADHGADPAHNGAHHNAGAVTLPQCCFVTANWCSGACNDAGHVRPMQVDASIENAQRPRRTRRAGGWQPSH